MEKWYLAAQMGLVCVCGALIALGKNSIITDLFIAGGSGLIFTSGYVKLFGNKE